MAQDELGNWLDLGTITPITTGYQLFDTPLINSETLRLTFTCNWATRSYYLGSYGLLRLYLPTAIITRTKPIKIWPNAEREILDFKVPEGLKNNGAFVGDLGIIRVLRRGYDFGALDPPWSLKIESK